jgi:hypothetical protein
MARLSAGATISTGAIDGVLGILTLGALALGVIGALHGGRWARRRSPARAGTIARLLPQLVVIGLSAALPAIAAWLMDRDAN